MPGLGDIPEDAHAGELGDDLLQKLQLFSAYLRGKGASPVMFPPGRARLATNPEPTGSSSNTMTMGIVDSRLLGRTGACRSLGDDNIYLETH